MTEFQHLLVAAAGVPPAPLDMALVRHRAERLSALGRTRRWLLALVGLAGIGLPIGIAVAPADRPAEVSTIDGEQRQVDRDLGAGRDAPAVDGGSGDRSATGGAPPISIPSIARPAADAAPEIAVTFASDRSGSWQIVVADTRLATPRTITTGGGEKRAPALSPDGTTVAYVSTASSGGNPTVRLVRSDGTADRALALDGFVNDPAWSPDGRLLAVTRRVPSSTPRGQPGRSEIWIVERDGSGARRLVASDGHDLQPAWSPDGARLAYVRFGTSGNASIWSVDSHGGAPTRSSPVWLHALRPAWSPDGSRLAFAGIEDDDGPSHIFTIKPDGSNLERISSGAAWDDGPTWLPDGQTLMFDRDTDGHEAPACLVGVGAQGVVNNCIPTSNGPGPGHLWAVDRDGTNARALTTGSANQIEPHVRSAQ